mmetsp:Transcript_26658/g.23469  ORF Transcript_26658/g.23469 Transcript_26658/m.23469 type:complete len:238 (+) Transcript_26658:795-1508(+)
MVVWEEEEEEDLDQEDSIKMVVDNITVIVIKTMVIIIMTMIENKAVRIITHIDLDLDLDLNHNLNLNHKIINAVKLQGIKIKTRTRTKIKIKMVIMAMENPIINEIVKITSVAIKEIILMMIHGITKTKLKTRITTENPTIIAEIIVIHGITKMITMAIPNHKTKIIMEKPTTIENVIVIVIRGEISQITIIMTMIEKKTKLQLLVVFPINHDHNHRKNKLNQHHQPDHHILAVWVI